MKNEKNTIKSPQSAARTGAPKRDYWDEAKKLWYKFSLNRMSVVGLCIIIVILILAIFQPVIAP